MSHSGTYTKQSHPGPSYKEESTPMTSTVSVEELFGDLIEKLENHPNEKIRQLEFLLYLFMERQSCYVNCNNLYKFDPAKLGAIFMGIASHTSLPNTIVVVKNGANDSPFEKFDLHIHITTSTETPSKINVKNIGNPINSGGSSGAGPSSGFESYNLTSDRQPRLRPVLLVKNLKTKLSEDPKESTKSKSDEPKEFQRTKVSDEIKDLYVINFDEWFYNPMDHVTQPVFRVLNDKSVEVLKKKYNVKESGIPKMDCILKDGEKKDSDKDYKGDIIGRFMGFRTGEIVEIQRKTLMNGIQTYYRIAK